MCPSSYFVKFISCLGPRSRSVPVLDGRHRRCQQRRRNRTVANSAGTLWYTNRFNTVRHRGRRRNFLVTNFIIIPIIILRSVPWIRLDKYWLDIYSAEETFEPLVIKSLDKKRILTNSPNPGGACITDCGGSSSSDLERLG